MDTLLQQLNRAYDANPADTDAAAVTTAAPAVTTLIDNRGNNNGNTSNNDRKPKPNLELVKLRNGKTIKLAAESDPAKPESVQA